MINLALELKLSNIFNLLFGIMFGFFIMILISCALFSKFISKKNKNEEIRIISKRAYNDFYLKDKKIKDAIIQSLIYEVNEVSKIVHPEKKYPLYELSINDIINGLELIQKKLKVFINHPLCVDIKNIHIASLIVLEEKVAKPVVKVYNKKYIKALMFCYKVIMFLINLFNPVFYMKKIMSKVLIKKGKKEFSVLLLDFVGNTCYEIYLKETSKE